jgi:hypothetical protein
MLRALSTAGAQVARRAAAAEGKFAVLGARAFADAVPGKRDGDTLTLEVCRASGRLRVWARLCRRSPRAAAAARPPPHAAAHSSAHSLRRSTR